MGDFGQHGRQPHQTLRQRLTTRNPLHYQPTPLPMAIPLLARPTGLASLFATADEVTGEASASALKAKPKAGKTELLVIPVPLRLI